MNGDTNESPAREWTRAEVDATPGLVLLEFGATWCEFCQAFKPHLEAQLRKHPEVVHLTVEDGPGRPLGRSFRVKLWPTLVYLRDGQVIRQLARPRPEDVEAAMQELVGYPGRAS